MAVIRGSSDSIEYNATGSAAIADTFDPDVSFVMLEWRLHLNAVGGNPPSNVTLDLNSIAGAAYDINLLTAAMATVTDLCSMSEVRFKRGDQLLTVYDNPNAATWGLTIIYREGK